jgi:hypothetical protein
MATLSSTALPMSGSKQRRAVRARPQRSGKLDVLEIENDPALGAVRLDTIDTLEVVNNPLLRLTSFDPVRTFERTMTGNARDAP